MTILHQRQPLPRRTFLKAAGISLALPWLEAMSVRANSTTMPNEIFDDPALHIH